MADAWWTVHEIPRLQRTLLAVDQHQGLSLQHQEVLLRLLAMVAAVGLAGLQHGQADAGLRKPAILFQDAALAERRVGRPLAVLDVDHEPAVPFLDHLLPP